MYHDRTWKGQGTEHDGESIRRFGRTSASCITCFDDMCSYLEIQDKCKGVPTVVEDIGCRAGREKMGAQRLVVGIVAVMLSLSARQKARRAARVQSPFHSP